MAQICSHNSTVVLLYCTALPFSTRNRRQDRTVVEIRNTNRNRNYPFEWYVFDPVHPEKQDPALLRSPLSRRSRERFSPVPQHPTVCGAAAKGCRFRKLEAAVPIAEWWVSQFPPEEEIIKQAQPDILLCKRETTPPFFNANGLHIFHNCRQRKGSTFNRVPALQIGEDFGPPWKHENLSPLYFDPFRTQGVNTVCTVPVSLQGSFVHRGIPYVQNDGN